MIWAKDMAFPIVSAIAHTMTVKNKIGIDSHLTRAIIQRAKILAETVEDYLPIYSYVDPKERVYDEATILSHPDSFKVCLSAPEAVALKLENGLYQGKTPVIRTAEPVDRRTTIKFTRYYPIPGGKTEKVIEYGSFLLSEADNAGLLSKSNWQNWERDCMHSRAYSRGGRRVGDDFLLGAYSKLELADMSDIDIELNQEDL